MTFPGSLGVLRVYTPGAKVRGSLLGAIHTFYLLFPKFRCGPHLADNTRRLQFKIENTVSLRAFFEMPSKFLTGADHVLGVKSATCSSYACVANTTRVHVTV